MTAPLHGPHLELNEAERQSLWRGGVLIAKVLLVALAALPVIFISWLFLPLALLAFVVATSGRKILAWWRQRK